MWPSTIIALPALAVPPTLSTCIVSLSVFSYFPQVTHIVFVLSEWGRCQLSVDDLPEEYLFLRTALRWLILTDECELVGEVLQVRICEQLAVCGTGNRRGKIFMFDEPVPVQ